MSILEEGPIRRALKERFLGFKLFEQKISPRGKALAEEYLYFNIQDEEEANKRYVDQARNLRIYYPDIASMLEEIALDEDEHKRRMIEALKRIM
jgi:rubrerythrin